MLIFHKTIENEDWSLKNGKSLSFALMELCIT